MGYRRPVVAFNACRALVRVRTPPIDHDSGFVVRWSLSQLHSPGGGGFYKQISLLLLQDADHAPVLDVGRALLLGAETQAGFPGTAVCAEEEGGGSILINRILHMDMRHVAQVAWYAVRHHGGARYVPCSSNLFFTSKLFRLGSTATAGVAFSSSGGGSNHQPSFASL